MKPSSNLVLAVGMVAVAVAVNAYAQAWTPPMPVNTNAATDVGTDRNPQVATDGIGTWLAVWESNDNLGGTIGDDYDILCATMGPSVAVGSVFQVSAVEAAVPGGMFRVNPKGTRTRFIVLDNGVGLATGTDPTFVFP